MVSLEACSRQPESTCIRFRRRHWNFPKICTISQIVGYSCKRSYRTLQSLGGHIEYRGNPFAIIPLTGIRASPGEGLPRKTIINF